jgi:hypothetical protein
MTRPVSDEMPGGALPILEDQDQEQAHYFGIDEDPPGSSTLTDSDDGVDETSSRHAYDSSTGLLTVSPEGPHPIFELTRRARKRWTEKLARASKTLPQAVREYRRRYNRHPPRGFDDWWAYVQKHNIQLPDEYDAIHDDLEPYWGFKPAFLRETQLEREAVSDTYTIGKRSWDSVVTLLNISISDERRVKTRDYLSWGVYPQLELLNEVAQWIPPFRATISPDDRPGEFQDWEWREAALKSAKAGKRMRLRSFDCRIPH